MMIFSSTLTRRGRHPSRRCPHRLIPERRSRAPTAAPPGDRLPRLRRKSTRSTERRSRAPTAAPPGGRHPRPWRKSTRPTERRSHAPTAAPPGDRLPRHWRKSTRPTEQPFARAHCSTSRWPPARQRASPLVPRSAVRSRPLQHLQVAVLRGIDASHLVPRSAVRSRPLQHLQVAASAA